MTRHGLLRIAMRHPRMFAAMNHAKHGGIGESAHMAGARGNPPAALSCRPERITADSNGSLRGLTNAPTRTPYIWDNVPWRTDAPARRRDEPRSSRFGELT